jgi:membrane protein DedA with SNARE-associated domain
MDWSAAELMELARANWLWSPLAAFLFAMGDSTALVSLFLPGTPLLVAMGAMVAAGELGFWPVVAGAAAGSVAGSTLSWWIGHHFGRAALGYLPLDRHPDMARKAIDGLRRWGPWAVFAAHVFPPLTSVMFLVAGAVGIPFWRFQRFNLPGAVIAAWLLPATGQLGYFLWELAKPLWPGN